MDDLAKPRGHENRAGKKKEAQLTEAGETAASFRLFVSKIFFPLFFISPSFDFPFDFVKEFRGKVRKREEKE